MNKKIFKRLIVYVMKIENPDIQRTKTRLFSCVISNLIKQNNLNRMIKTMYFVAEFHQSLRSACVFKLLRYQF